MKLYYNPVDTDCKSIIGAVKVYQKIKFCVFFDCSDFCNMMIVDDIGGETVYPMTWQDDKYCCEVTFSKTGLYFYYFNINHRLVGRGNLRKAEFDNAEKYQILVHTKYYETPLWLKGGIIYQIFPDRFCKDGSNAIGKDKILRDDWGDVPQFLPDQNKKIKNNDFFGGNLKGIISKINYLKSLNVKAIYLNPIFEAYSNHRYDTGNYLKIDSLLGDEKDFKKLIDKCEKNGIKIIIDGVFNHTGDDSIYFNKYGKYSDTGAYQSKNSKYYQWYSFLNYPEVYESWWGIKTLPQVKKNNKSYLEFITGKNGVIEHWLNLGVCGVRLDVADELPDSFISEIRKAVKRTNKEAIIIGEVWEDATNKISYNVRKKYFQGNGLDSVMNYVLKDAIISTVLFCDTSFFKEAVLQLIDNYPKIVLDNLMNILGTHDTSRILTVLSGKVLATKQEKSIYKLNETERKTAFNRFKFATVLLYTVFGVPCIYYGDEIGMEGFEDPFNRKCYPWGYEDKNFVSWFKTLGKLRDKPEFIDGDYKELYSDKQCIVFERRKGKRAVTTAINLGESIYHLNFKGEIIDLLTNIKYFDKFCLKGESMAVLCDNND